MARLWSTGFELQTTTVGVEWTTTTNGTPAIETSIVHGGAAALRINNTTVAENIHHIVASAQGVRYYRFYINMQAAPSAILEFISVLNSGSRKVSIRSTTGRALQLYNQEDSVQVGSDSSALTLNTWYRLELKIDSTTLASTAVEARLYAASAESTLLWNPSGTIDLLADPNRLLVGLVAGNSTFDMVYDDIAVNDNSGTYQNSWPGAGQLCILRPNGAGDNTQWTRGGADSGSNWGQVDETTPNDVTDYVQSNTSGQIDDYTLTDTPAGMNASDIINWVGPSARFAISSTTGGDPDFVLRLKPAAAGTVDETPNLSGTGAIAYASHQTAAPVLYPVLGNSSNYEQPGTSSAWTKATLDTAQVGIRETVTDTHFMIVSAVWVYVDYTTNTSTQYTQSVSGGMTPSGTVTKQGNKTVGGSISSIVGTISKAISKTVAGGITPTGTPSKLTSKFFSGAITSIVGTLQSSRVFLKDLAGTLTSSGTLTKSALKSLAGTVTSVGTILKSSLKTLAGSITPSGLVSKFTTKTFSGAITSIVGTLTKSSTKTFAGSITPSGTVSKQAAKAFTGNISPTGSISKSIGKILGSVLTSSGNLAKFTSKTLSGVLTWAGNLVTDYIPAIGGNTFFQSVGGTLTSGGQLLKRTSKFFSGGLSPAGSLSKTTAKLFSGTLTSSGSIAKSISKLLTGNISPNGVISRFITKTFGGSITPTGSANKSTTKQMSGSLPSSGGILKTTLKQLAGTLTSSGGIGRAFAKLLSGGITPEGQVNKLTFKEFIGNLTSSGILGRVLNPILAAISRITLKGIHSLRVNLLGTHRPTEMLRGESDDDITLSGDIKP